MTNLMLIESPGKKGTLTKILTKLFPGETWRVEATVGHLRDLPASGKDESHIVTGVLKETYKPVYEVNSDKVKLVAALKKAVAEAKCVYIASDPDREGESIGWHMRQALRIENYVRVAFPNITLEAVAEAFRSPRKLDMNRVAAQECRRVIDRGVGYLVSDELYRQMGKGGSAGRVQSIAVKMVVQREREIRNFKKTSHYGAAVVFADAKIGGWQAEWMIDPDLFSPGTPYFLNQAHAAQIAETKQVRVLGCVESIETRSPPPPFITSTLQQAASVHLKLKPKATMQAAQKLYERGHITYMRTDNPNVPEESMPEIVAVAQQLGLKPVSERRVFKARGGAQEGHAACVPTQWDLAEAGETDDERALYSLIRIRAIASQLEDASFDARTLSLQATHPVEGRDVKFTAKGRTLTYAGWLKILAGDDTEEDDEKTVNNTAPVPRLEVGQILDVAKGIVLEKATIAPKRYTEASLIKVLEKEGIGRPATYASILANILDKEHIREDAKRQLWATELGEGIYDRLQGNFSFFEVAYTNQMEAALDQIAAGTAAYLPTVKKVLDQVEEEIAAQKSKVPTYVKPVEIYPCKACGNPMRRIAKGEHGPFWGCTNHPTCEETLPDANGKPGQKKVVALSNFACKKCGKPLIHRKKTGKKGFDFFGCSDYPKCDALYPSVKGKPNFGQAK